MSKQKIKPKPCRMCKGRDIEISDCGYSSFNAGSAKCKKCGHQVSLSPCSCFPEEALITAWNADKPSVEEQLVAAKKEIRRLKKLLKLSQSGGYSDNYEPFGNGDY